MKLLAMVLTHLQTDLGRLNCKINLKPYFPLLTIAVHAMVEYVCVRLENKEEIPNFRAGVKDAALSLKALAGMTARFPRGDASVAAKAVFSLTSTSLREQKPATRLALFELLAFLVQTYSATLTRDMGPHLFVDGLVSMSAFDRDPKCIRVLCQMYEQISQTWSLNSEDFQKIWGSVSKYWPISFKEDPLDPSIPTVTELNFLIQTCFTSHDNYAVHAFEHLLTVLNTSGDTVAAYTKVTFLILQLQVY
jgi:DNA repair/transcription protein MET18/MMS19